MATPVFTQRHHTRVAAVLRAGYDEVREDPADEAMKPWVIGSRVSIETLTWNLAVMFAADNPRFQRRRFMLAALGQDPNQPTVSTRKQREKRER